MSKLQVIVGSTHPGRSADLVVPWVASQASAHSGFDAEVLDLRDWSLPIFSEHLGTIGDFSDPTYSGPLIKAWNQKIKEGDAYIFVTPEYNHSVPGVPKNAIDTVWISFAFRNKPIAAVGYSAGVGGGIRCDRAPRAHRSRGRSRTPPKNRRHSVRNPRLRRRRSADQPDHPCQSRHRVGRPGVVVLGA
jgi:NAD(P)H-dependent FMN reductase